MSIDYFIKLFNLVRVLLAYINGKSREDSMLVTLEYLEIQI